MKKLVALILSVLILSLAGCKPQNTSSDNTSSTNIISDTSLILEDISSKTENSQIVENSSIITNNNQSNNVNSVVTTPNVAKENNTNSQNDSSIRKKEYNTGLNTITINQKTRYFGFLGYFELESASSGESGIYEKFDRYGIPYDKDKCYIKQVSTEYRADENTRVYFVTPDYDRIILRDVSPMYDEFMPFSRTVNIIDGEGISPEKDVSPEMCDTIYTKKLVNYLGFDGYFVDECEEISIFKGYGSFFTEYYNVKTDSHIHFVFDADISDSDMDIKIQEMVYDKGIGSIPVNVVEYSNSIPKENYKKFDYKIDDYYIKDYDIRSEDPAKGYSMWLGNIEIFTVGKNENTEQEIKAKFKETYGYECYSEQHFFAGYFYVDGYDGICEVYKYYVY